MNLWKQLSESNAVCLGWMQWPSYWINPFIYILNVDIFFLQALRSSEKVPYQARMCVKDSFVKCWQKPHKPLPSPSSPPTHAGGCQKTPRYGVVLASCHLQHGEAHCMLHSAERGSVAVAGDASTAALHAGRLSETTVCDGVNTPAESTARNCVPIALRRLATKRMLSVLSRRRQLAPRRTAFSVGSYFAAFPEHCDDF